MANVQKYFEEFHEAIRLSDTDENEELREKRDIILNRLNEKKADNVPKYTPFNQGSYAMGTGVKPIDGEYDIDVGIRFDISKDDYPDPVEVKKWVYDALQDHTSEVKMRRSCVTVTYFKDGEPEFHVDLAIYAANNDDGKLYLAKGKLYSDDENKYWEVSNPLELITKIRNKYEDADDRNQFRRVIRYLKRWKDVNFTTDGSAAPTGIGLTVAAYNFLTISKQYDFATGKYKYNDLSALKNLVQSILSSFRLEYNQEEGKGVERLRISLPTEPYNDLFEKMSDSQMADFKVKLEELKTTLNNAEVEPDPHEACKILKKVFGKDFPVPPKEETGQRKNLAFFGTSASA
ncbi:conserved hypothetical protein [Thermoanaerobacter italicus Ab9]|uniref:Cyclic GMP-AMP synthase n=1 Tax=Thermoanaerobacter italicus (strain DSM 9252 / Ab9) TaxID=580331 RepID=D3T4G3_THEIA|nr:nucleotidyltransferase [Thermoanaerobacter italicus]ADD03115.1 conserved hypothetical protein [Thermoanaerobacter italicus Ab9]